MCPNHIAAISLGPAGPIKGCQTSQSHASADRIAGLMVFTVGNLLFFGAYIPRLSFEGKIIVQDCIARDFFCLTGKILRTSPLATNYQELCTCFFSEAEKIMARLQGRSFVCRHAHVTLFGSSILRGFGGDDSVRKPLDGMYYSFSMASRYSQSGSCTFWRFRLAGIILAISPVYQNPICRQTLSKARAKQIPRQI